MKIRSHPLRLPDPGAPSNNRGTAIQTERRTER